MRRRAKNAILRSVQAGHPAPGREGSDRMVTIKQIAQQLHISPSTVSIVLSGKGAARKISQETQKRIYDTAAAMGYQPNIAARSLRGGVGADELQVAMFWVLVPLKNALAKRITSSGLSLKARICTMVFLQL